MNLKSDEVNLIPEENDNVTDKKIGSRTSRNVDRNKPKLSDRLVNKHKVKTEHSTVLKNCESNPSSKQNLTKFSHKQTS